MPDFAEVIAIVSDNQRIQDPNTLIQRGSELLFRSLAELTTATGNPTVGYFANWTSPLSNPSLCSIDYDDIHGFMTVFRHQPKKALNLILHSPGGSPGAAEGLVEYMRSRFERVTVFVPHSAMSAATLMCCAAEEVVMGAHSFLGPTDPQYTIQTQDGAYMVSAHGILADFEDAKAALKADPSLLPAYLPRLQAIKPGQHSDALKAIALSKALAKDYLERFMFKSRSNPSAQANSASEALADAAANLSHGRMFGRQKLRDWGFAVRDLEENKAHQDYVLTSFHAANVIFALTLHAKLLVNDKQKTWFRSDLRVQQAQVPLQREPSQPVATPE